MTVLKLRILFDHAMFGPGKAELLSRIAELGSISAAGRQMGMSYKRAWMLVEEMNAAFRDALVESSRGGAGGGGARVTETGLTVLGLYRSVEESAAQAAEAQVDGLRALLADIPDRK